MTVATLVLLCVLCVRTRLCEPKRDLLWGSNPAAGLQSELRCVDGVERADLADSKTLAQIYGVR